MLMPWPKIRIDRKSKAWSTALALHINSLIATMTIQGSTSGDCRYKNEGNKVGQAVLYLTLPICVNKLKP